jgi:hypothetical protein
MECDVWIALASLLESGPRLIGVEERFNDNEADTQTGESTVKGVTLGAGLVFSHAVVAHPVVADFTTAPVAAGEACKAFGTAFHGRVAGDVEGYLRCFVLGSCAGAPYDDQTACTGQFGLQWLEGIDTYASLVEAPVGGVGFFGVGKKGVVCALSRAAW